MKVPHKFTATFYEDFFGDRIATFRFTLKYRGVLYSNHISFLDDGWVPHYRALRELVLAKQFLIKGLQDDS